LFLAFFTLVPFFLLLEIITSFTKDLSLYSGSVYFQLVAPEIHQLSENPLLKYELKPNSFATDSPVKYKINSFGFRNREYSIENLITLLGL